MDARRRRNRWSNQRRCWQVEVVLVLGMRSWKMVRPSPNRQVRVGKGKTRRGELEKFVDETGAKVRRSSWLLESSRTLHLCDVAGLETQPWLRRELLCWAQLGCRIFCPSEVLLGNVLVRSDLAVELKEVSLAYFGRGESSTTSSLGCRSRIEPLLLLWELWSNIYLQISTCCWCLISLSQWISL